MPRELDPLDKNVPINELLEQYTEDGCDFTDIQYCTRAALRYAHTMEDSHVRCLLYSLAQYVTDTPEQYAEDEPRFRAWLDQQYARRSKKVRNSVDT